MHLSQTGDFPGTHLSTSLATRRSRLRDGGAAVLSGGVRLRPSPSLHASTSSTASPLLGAATLPGLHQTSHTDSGTSVAFARDAGFSNESLDDSGTSAAVSVREAVDGGTWATSDNMAEGANADDEEQGRDFEREHELHAQVHDLQRQLEELQLATATLQAVVSPLSQQEPFARSLLQTAADRDTEQREVSEEADDAEVHPHVTCDGCGAGPPLVGQVMKCLDCDDFDFCFSCYQERDQHGHPRDHRFRRRTVGTLDHAVLPSMQGSHGPMAGILLRLLEAELLYAALQTGDDEDPPETQEDKEMRSAEVLSTLERILYVPPAERQEKDGLQAPACEECALCLDEYSPGEQVLRLPCRHLFHEGCLGPWFTKSLTCPMCKQEL